MHEHELSEQLHAAVADVSARPDLSQIELGAARVRSRRRVATGVVAAMLVAAAGGAGFGLGRSVGDGDDQLTAAVTDDAAEVARASGDAVATTAVERAAPPRTTLPLFVAPSPSPGYGQATSEVATDSAAVGVDGDYYGQLPMTLVYERQLDSGVRVRLMTGQSWADDGYGGEWRPAKFCYATKDSRLTFDGPDIVDVTGYGWYEELFNGLSVQVVEAGYADGRPLRVLQVQTAPDATEVAVVWADGAADRTAVVDGVAVLVVDGTNPFDDYSFEITDSAGTRTLTTADLNYYSDPEFRAACEEPPPPLPDAGEQPADPAAAEAALRERFDLLWNVVLAADEKPDDLLDDRTGVDAAIAAVLSGSFSDAAESATHIIEELVFTSPTEAWLRYGVDTTNGYFGQRYGTATLTNGVWVFPRALVCQDLSLAGGQCEPWVDAIYPPAWYERYGEPAEQCYETEDGTVCEASGEAWAEPALEAPAAELPVPTTTVPGG